jgi:tetratricopeptide (TPR) repeat protein
VNAADAKRQAQEAQRHQRRAEASYRLARRGLGQIVTKVGDDPRLRSGPLEDLRRNVLEAERDFYEAFVRLRGDEPDFQVERGRAYMQLGKLYRVTGRAQQAEAAGKMAQAIFRRLADADANKPQFRQELARSLQALGDVFRDTGRHREAESAFQGARAIQQVLTAAHPREPAYWFELSVSCNYLGLVYVATKRSGEAEAAWKEARAIQQKLVDTHPQVPQYQSHLAGSHNNLGILYRDTGRNRKAATAYQDALAIRKHLAEAHPQNGGYKRDLAASYNGLAVYYHRTVNLEQANVAFEKALAIRKHLADIHPVVIEYAIDLGAAYSNLGKLAFDTGKTPEALTWLGKARQQFEAVAQKAPRDTGARSNLCIACWGQALALGRLGRHAEALADWERALQVAAVPVRSLLRLYRALTLARLKDHARATAEADAVVRVAKNVSGDTFHNAACVYALSVAAVQEHPPQAAAYAARAVALLRQAIQKGYTTRERLEHDKDLDPLRQHPDFQKLLSQLGKKP